jgi:hypothetical protein
MRDVRFGGGGNAERERSAPLLVLNADGLLWGEVLVQAPYMITRR